jgi:hypothetical protein
MRKLTLEAIDWQTFAVKPLLVLPDQVETKISLSPDGLELLLDGVVAKKSEPVTGDLRTDDPSAIAQSSLMLLSLKKTSKLNGELSPQPLPLQGLRALIFSNLELLPSLLYSLNPFLAQFAAKICPFLEIFWRRRRR